MAALHITLPTLSPAAAARPAVGALLGLEGGSGSETKAGLQKRRGGGVGRRGFAAFGQGWGQGAQGCQLLWRCGS